MKTSTANSSQGYVEFDAETGLVLAVYEYHNTDDTPTNLSGIGSFDIEEYKRHYNVSELPDSIDILDLGYWLEDESYEEPSHDWREEKILLQNEKL